MRVCVHVCVLDCILPVCLRVYLCCFGPMGDCCHCCVKQIRELGGFGRITTLDFRATFKTRYIVNCIPMHVHTHTMYTNTHILWRYTYIHTYTHTVTAWILTHWSNTMLLLDDSAKPQIIFINNVFLFQIINTNICGCQLQYGWDTSKFKQLNCFTKMITVTLIIHLFKQTKSDQIQSHYS